MEQKAAPELQAMFNRACGFWNVQKALTRHLLVMTESVVELQADARALCGVTEPEDVQLTGMLCAKFWLITPIR